ncbi:MAG: hypothetical protein SGJ20_21735 [Planctomycetota bacterium]|nr:hypothetical protein [Planctomycetota bacterium]
MEYRAEATSVEGFVQQIACCYLRHGYWFYVSGWIPQGKDPRSVDEKLISKYGIAVSESTRARRKQAGKANLQYIRHERFFVILATKGEHRFFVEEENLIRDIRRVPLKFAGYSISYRRGGRTREGQPDSKWHSHVEIDRRQLLDLKAWLTDQAGRATTADVAKTIYSLPVESYAPVRRQLLMLLRAVNRTRRESGRPTIPLEVLPLRRRVVKPFHRHCADVSAGY